MHTTWHSLRVTDVMPQLLGSSRTSVRTFTSRKAQRESRQTGGPFCTWPVQPFPSQLSGCSFPFWQAQQSSCTKPSACSASEVGRLCISVCSAQVSYCSKLKL